MARILVAFCVLLALAAGSSTFASASGDGAACEVSATSAARKFPHPHENRPPVEEDPPAEEQEDPPVEEQEDPPAEDPPVEAQEPTTEEEPPDVETAAGTDEDMAVDEGALVDEIELDASAARCDAAPKPVEAEPAQSGRTRRGGRGPDRFVGDRSVNVFFGGAGDDYLDGAGGRDELRGGPGSDVIITGAERRRPKTSGGKRAKAARVTRRGDYANGAEGNDRIRARNGRADYISCGRGRDTVLAEPGDTTTESCETVKYG